MEFQTDVSAIAPTHTRFEEARREMAMIGQVAERALADLPTHRALIDRVYAEGFSRPARGVA
jgi:tryptophan halogenase